MKKTDQWWDVSWNPVTGCTPISEGCENCYARRMAYRLAYIPGSGYDASEKPFDIRYRISRIGWPLKWKNPRRVFVCSMGDLFHEDVRDKWIGLIYGQITAAWWHTFVVLTKRPDRMAEFHRGLAYYPKGNKTLKPILGPLPNLWLGVTAETQARADDRISILLQIPAAVWFVSVEPLLGPVDLRPWLPPFTDCDHYGGGCTRPENVFADPGNPHARPGIMSCRPDYCVFGRRGISWVICGAETGPDAQPMNPDWARDLRDQCKAAGVPFWMKKMTGGKHWHGAEPPEDLQIRELPEAVTV